MFGQEPVCPWYPIVFNMVVSNNRGNWLPPLLQIISGHVIKTTERSPLSC